MGLKENISQNLQNKLSPQTAVSPSLITPWEKHERGGQVGVENLHEAVLGGEYGPGQFVHHLILVQVLPLYPEPVGRPDVVGDQPVAQVLEHLLTKHRPFNWELRICLQMLHVIYGESNVMSTG